MRLVCLCILCLAGFVSCKKDFSDIPYENLNVPVSVALRDIHVFNQSKFILVGGDDGYGVVVKTTDGGASWQVLDAPFDNQLNCLQFLNADTGLTFF